MANNEKNSDLASIYGAIWDLQTFTIGDGARTANVSPDRFKAVVKNLQKDGMVKGEILRGKCESMLLYRLSEDKEKRYQFGQRLSSYRPFKWNPDPVFAQELVKDLNPTLDELELEFNKISKGSISSVAQHKIQLKLERAEAGVRCILFFCLGRDDNKKLAEDHPAIVARKRVLEAQNRARDFGIELN